MYNHLGGEEGYEEKPGRVGGQRVLVGVLVSLSCYTSRLSGINNKNVFPEILESGKFKMRVLADSVSGEGSLVCRQLLSWYILTLQTKRE